MDNFSNRQFAEEISRVISIPDERRAYADKIVKKIKNSVDQYDLASLILPREDIPLGTTAEYAVDGQLKAYWHEPGSYAPRTRMVKNVFTVPQWMVSAHPEYNIQQLRAGRYGTAQDQIEAGKQAITGAINARVWSTVSGSVSASDDNYATSAGGLTKTALDQGITWVDDQAEGGVAAIVGRKNVLSRIKDFGYDTSGGDPGLFSDEMKNEVMRTGKIRTYMGVPIVGLPKWRDGYGKLTIPQDEVLVVGYGAGRYVVSEDMDQLDDTDIDNLTWHIHLWMMVGVAVFFPERIFKIKIT